MSIKIFSYSKEMADQVKEPTKNLVEAIGLPSIIIQNPQMNQIKEEYLSMRKTGEKEGYVPVIIIPSDILLECLEDREEEINAMIESADRIDPNDCLKKRWAELTPPEGFDADFEEFQGGSTSTNFASIEDYATGRAYQELVIAKIPTDKPWEVAAYIPMGGFNDCPSNEEILAIFKKWYEQYRAIPAVVSYDIWEMYVEEPVKTRGESVILAREQYAFCYDIVDQGCGSIGALAGELYQSNYWYFWWD